MDNNLKDEILHTQVVNAAYGMAQSLTPTAGKTPTEIANDVTTLARLLMESLHLDFARTVATA